MISCRKPTELVTDDQEGRLSFVHRQSFQMHLRMGRHRRGDVQRLREAARLVDKVPSGVRMTNQVLLVVADASAGLSRACWTPDA